MFNLFKSKLLVICFWMQACGQWRSCFSFVPAPFQPFGLLKRVELSSGADTLPEKLDVALEKPLGMILEEVAEGEAEGVFVLELAEEGSAATSGFKELIVGRRVATVMGEDVTKLVFDDVMDRIMKAPSPVSLQFVEQGQPEVTEPLFAAGTVVTINVMEDGKETTVNGKVGDNLRKVLLENNVEVYKGLKKKLGNCGGGGQCTFCAAEFVSSDGWEPRSDYENQKLGHSPASRLTCLTNIQGPATIRI